jgi:hypothetical protein
MSIIRDPDSRREPESGDSACASDATSAWARHAERLADWALRHLVVRRDCCGGYRLTDTPQGQKVKPFTSHEPLTRERLIRHFCGTDLRDRVGVHLISPDDETCKATVVDIDAHGDDDDPARNHAFALHVLGKALSRQVDALLLDSDGRGGYHVWSIHAGPIPAAESYRHGKWLIDGWATHGLAKPPESFPKSPSLTGKRFGNWVRLPGRHHKREHWTRVWDLYAEGPCGGWVAGEAAIRAILRMTGSHIAELCKELDIARPTPLIPAEFELRRERSGTDTPARSIDADGLKREARLARDALTHLGPEYHGDYERWLAVGMALRQLGDQGLLLWHEWSARSESKYQPGVLDQKWETFAAPGEGDREDFITLGTLFAWAQEHDWDQAAAMQTGVTRRPRRSFRIQFGK